MPRSITPNTTVPAVRRKGSGPLNCCEQRDQPVDEADGEQPQHAGGDHDAAADLAEGLLSQRLVVIPIAPRADQVADEGQQQEGQAIFEGAAQHVEADVDAQDVQIEDEAQHKAQIVDAQR